MRLLNKLKIFFRLKKEETIEFFKYNQTLHGLFGLVLLTVFVIIGLAIPFTIIGFIAHLFQSYEWWTNVLYPKHPFTNVFELGALLTMIIIVGSGFLLLAVFIFIVLPFKFMKWIYSNWKLAEKELIKQEKENESNIR